MSDSTRSRILEVMAEILASTDWETTTSSKAASDILAHLSAEGMAVVPVEPTEEMVSAAETVFCTSGRLTLWSELYDAMLSASPYGKASMQEASAEREARSEQIPPGKEESK